MQTSEHFHTHRTTPQKPSHSLHCYIDEPDGDSQTPLTLRTSVNYNTSLCYSYAAKPTLFRVPVCYKYSANLFGLTVR